MGCGIEPTDAGHVKAGSVEVISLLNRIRPVPHDLQFLAPILFFGGSIPMSVCAHGAYVVQRLASASARP
jgi:hypothetical protein